MLSRLLITSNFDASSSDIHFPATCHAHTHQIGCPEAIYHYHHEHESVTANSRVAVQLLAYLDLLAVQGEQGRRVQGAKALLARTVEAAMSASSGGPAPASTASERPKKLQRISQACDLCHRRSIRCRPSTEDPQQHCQNCFDFGVPCTYNRPSRRRRNGSVSRGQSKPPNTLLHEHRQSVVSSLLFPCDFSGVTNASQSQSHQQTVSLMVTPG